MFGRQREVDALWRALERTIVGQPYHSILIGEPGIGKTRLASEASNRAKALGFTVSVGQCIERSEAPSYWPWIQICRDLLLSLECDPELSGPLTELVSRMRGDATTGSSGEAFQIAEGVADVLRIASNSIPRLILIEDMHWADVPSLTVLEACIGLIRESKVAIVVTSRDLDPRKSPGLDVAIGLSRLPEVGLLELGPLTGNELTRLIDYEFGDRTDREVTASIATRSHGNPLFATQLAKEFKRTNSANPDLPATIQRTLARRFIGLSSECMGMLIIAAVIGDEFGFSLLELVARRTGKNATTALLNEAIHAGIIASGSEQLQVHTCTRTRRNPPRGNSFSNSPGAPCSRRCFGATRRTGFRRKDRLSPRGCWTRK